MYVCTVFNVYIIYNAYRDRGSFSKKTYIKIGDVAFVLSAF